MGTYEFEQKFLDVEGGKQLALSVDYDLSGRLSWDWLVGLHDLCEKERVRSWVWGCF